MGTIHHLPPPVRKHLLSNHHLHLLRPHRRRMCIFLRRKKADSPLSVCLTERQNPHLSRGWEMRPRRKPRASLHPSRRWVAGDPWAVKVGAVAVAWQLAGTPEVVLIHSQKSPARVVPRVLWEIRRRRAMMSGMRSI